MSIINGCANCGAYSEDKKMMVWVAVTPDRYELPIAVGDSARELAQMLGVSTQSIFKTIWRHAEKERSGKRVKPSKWRIYKVEI